MSENTAARNDCELKDDTATDRATSSGDDYLTDATVLVVDDEPNIVTLLETWLETIGCRVLSACDGQQGVDKAREFLPDLVLMDGMMPRLSGFEACQALKRDEATKDIPIIFLTVQGEVQDVVKGLELGAHGYMTKPFKPQELLARVRSTLKIKKIQDRLKQHTQVLRKRWDWIYGALEQLPLCLLVIDADTRELLFYNECWQNRLGALEALAASPVDCIEFLRDGKACSDVFLSVDKLSNRYEIVVQGQSKGEFNVLASSFEKNARRGRQILVF